ncbi:MAG: hypothetical protein N3E38_00915 [Candidatus Aenigmarchaeota archaeon]|nr:hypothetical protein [Candidatus Aenigmarchaeota archaeon]
MKDTPSERYVGQVLCVRIEGTTKTKFGEDRGSPCLKWPYGFYNDRVVEVRPEGHQNIYKNPLNLRPGDIVRVKIIRVYADGAVLRGVYLNHVNNQ